LCGVIIRRLAPPTIFVAPVVSGPTWLRCMGSVTRLAPRVDAGLRAWCAAARGVLAVLRLLFDVRAQPRRDCVTDAIVERSEGLPVAVMKWPRHRPVSARHRPGLALEELAPGDAARWTERMRLVLALSEPGWSPRLPTSCWSSAACGETGRVSACGVAHLERVVRRDVTAVRPGGCGAAQRYALRVRKLKEGAE